MLKFQISLKGSSSSIQDQVEAVFNQFIDFLKLPMNKFYTNNTSGLNQFKSKYNYTVTFNNKTNFNFDYDDDYIDFEEFERWSKENENKHKIPKLK